MLSRRNMEGVTTSVVRGSRKKEFSQHLKFDEKKFRLFRAKRLKQMKTLWDEGEKRGFQEKWSAWKGVPRQMKTVYAKITWNLFPRIRNQNNVINLTTLIKYCLKICPLDFWFSGKHLRLWTISLYFTFLLTDIEIMLLKTAIFAERK